MVVQWHLKDFWHTQSLQTGVIQRGAWLIHLPGCYYRPILAHHTFGLVIYCWIVFLFYLWARCVFGSLDRFKTPVLELSSAADLHPAADNCSLHTTARDKLWDDLETASPLCSLSNRDLSNTDMFNVFCTVKCSAVFISRSQFFNSKPLSLSSLCWFVFVANSHSDSGQNITCQVHNISY